MAAPKPLAGVAELADWLGEDIAEGTSDHKRALMCLRMASTLVRSEAGKSWLAEDGSSVEGVPEDAVMVTIYCASRVYENREAQTRGGIDDLSESWKVEEAGAYLTVTERRQVAALRGGTPGLSTVGTTRVEPQAAPGGLVPTGTPGVEFPWY